MIFVGAVSYALVSFSIVGTTEPTATSRFHVDNGWLYARSGGEGMDAARAPFVVFSDFYCAYCKLSASQLEEFASENTSRLAHEFRHYVTRGPAFNAAVVSECANELGQGKAMRTLLFSEVASLERHGAVATAFRAGITDTARFDACMSGFEARVRVVIDLEHAKKLGVGATPTIVIGRTVFLGYPGKQALDSALRAFIVPLR